MPALTSATWPSVKPKFFLGPLRQPCPSANHRLSQQTVFHVPLGSVFVRAGIHVCEFFELHSPFSPESINDLVLMNRPDPAHTACTVLFIGMDTFGDLKQGIMSYLFGVFER